MAYENKFKVKLQLRLILLADDFIIYSVNCSCGSHCTLSISVELRGRFRLSALIRVIGQSWNMIFQIFYFMGIVPRLVPPDSTLISRVPRASNILSLLR